MRINTFEELKHILKSKLPEFLDRMGIERSKNNPNMYRSFYPDTIDRHPSLHIFTSNNGDILYHCFSTNRTGDIFIANHIINGAPLFGYEFITHNVKPLCEMFDIEYTFRPLSAEEIEEMNMRFVYATVRDHIVATLRLSKTIDPKVLEYIQSKGIDINSESIVYNIGYCDNYENLVSNLELLGTSREYIESIGIKEYVFNSNSLVFAIADERNIIRGFAARNCYYDPDNRIGSKYYNIENNILYQKSKLLYNIQNAIKKYPGKNVSLYVVEGYTDAITLDKIGLKSVALGSTKFTHEHIELLQRLGETDIVLVLDGDEAGIENTARIITETMEGIKNFRVRIVTLPIGEDPDTFVRKYGKDALLDLEHITPFEWRLQRIKNDSNLTNYEIAMKMVPLIVNEHSPIEREFMCKKVADVCEIPLAIIRQEVQMLIDKNRLQQEYERDAVIENIIKTLKKTPADALLVLRNGVETLVRISEKYGNNIYDQDELIHELTIMKHHQENQADVDYLYYYGMPKFEHKMRGSTGGKLFLLGGQPNAGKTAWIVNWIINILRAHEENVLLNFPGDDKRYNNVCIFYHTIDDSRYEVIPRFLSVLAYDISKEVTINNVQAPNLEEYRNQIKDYDLFTYAREKAYEKLQAWIQDGRLIIKDATIGPTLLSGEMVLRRLRDKYPDRHIIYIIDNLHNLQDFSNLDDEVKRIKEISAALKQNILVPNKIMGLCTVEYRKGQGETKSRILLNELMKESKSLEYHANWIGHLVNEMHNSPDSKMYFYDPAVSSDDITLDDRLPIVSLIVGKNKVTNFKGEIHYFLYPQQGIVKEVTIKDLSMLNQEVRERLMPYYISAKTNTLDDIYNTILNASNDTNLNNSDTDNELNEIFMKSNKRNSSVNLKV